MKFFWFCQFNIRLLQKKHIYFNTSVPVIIEGTVKRCLWMLASIVVSNLLVKYALLIFLKHTDSVCVNQ